MPCPRRCRCPGRLLTSGLSIRGRRTANWVVVLDAVGPSSRSGHTAADDIEAGTTIVGTRVGSIYGSGRVGSGLVSKCLITKGLTAFDRVRILTPATQSPFYTFWPCDQLVLWPFDLILIGGRGLVMDYPCGKFGDFSFIRFWVIVRTDRQNHTHTHTHTHRRGWTSYSRDCRWCE